MERVKKAVIPAAGKGTRFLPVTRVIPKEMLPVGRIPMIQYAVAESVLAGISDCFVIIAPGKELIRSYLSSLSPTEILSPFVLRPSRSLTGSKNATISESPSTRNQGDSLPGSESLPFSTGSPGTDKAPHAFTIHYLLQTEPRGLADALLMMKPYVDEDEPFAVLLPDNVVIDPAPTEHSGHFFISNTISQLASALSEPWGRPVLGISRVTKDTAPLFGNCGRIEFAPAEGDVVTISALAQKEEGCFDLHGRDDAFRTVGRYIIFKNFLDQARGEGKRVRGELDDVPIFRNLLASHGLRGVLLRGELYDAGNPAGYAAANARVAGPEYYLLSW
jgi:UTP--glucose-1-phosphate uridylyltransferase